MNEEEMKQKNEEILKKWRSFGLLDGLKGGSINEWRCAKSFDDMAYYLIDNGYDGSFLSVLVFPFIRKVLCSGKKRLHRLINPKEVIEFLETTTPNECFEYAVKNRKNIASKHLLITIIRNLLNYQNCGDKTLKEFFNNMSLEEEEPYKVISAITKDVLDLTAELIFISTDLFVEVSSKKQKEG